MSTSMARSFTESDWAGFASAENFFNDDEPVLRHCKDGNLDFDLIADNSGVHILYCTDDGLEELFSPIEFPSGKLAALFLNSLPVSIEELKALGFKSI